MTSKKALKGQASITSNSNHLRISLPRKLYDGKQKYISLGLTDTPTNRSKAQIKLMEVQRDIDYDCFDLSLVKYSNKPPKTLVDKKLIIQDLLNSFEDKYFFTRSRNRQSLATFKEYINCLNRCLKEYLNDSLNEEIIIKVIGSTKAATKTRLRVVGSLRVFCDTHRFKYDFTGLSNGYKPKPRNLPKDEDIICAYTLIQKFARSDDNNIERAKSWGWVLMVLATYGLRAHELFGIDYDKSFKKEDDYALVLDPTLTNGLKTGGRKVYPIPKDWVEQFDLTNIKNKVLIGYESRIREFSVILWGRIKGVQKRLGCDPLRECLNFLPYDLRHRYAVRGHELGYPAEAVARWMGHSLTMHTGKYQKWLKDDTDKIVFRNSTFRAEELKRAAQNRSSYEELEAKIKLLQEENQALRQRLNLEDFTNT